MTIKRFLRRHNRLLLVLAVVLLAAIFLWSAHSAGYYYIGGIRYEIGRL